MTKKIFRNEEITRLLMAIPKGHRHIRTLLETRDGWIILQEATIAGLVRAYITLITHPSLDGIELVQKSCDERKQGYAESQLVESTRTSTEVLSEISQLLKE